MTHLNNVPLNNWTGEHVDIEYTADGRFTMYDYEWQVELNDNGFRLLDATNGNAIDYFNDDLECFTEQFYILDDQNINDLEYAVRRAVQWIANYV